MFAQHSPFSWTCHFFEVDTSPFATSYPLSLLLVGKVDQQTGAQCCFCMNRKPPTSYPLSSLSPQALEDKNHPPVKQKVWCDFSIRSHTKGLRPMEMSPYWLHTNIYSPFCLQAETCFAFCIKWLRSITETQPVLNWKLPPAFHREVSAFLQIHIRLGSHLLFVTGSHQVNTWERAWEKIFLSFIEGECKCITHGKVHSTQQA